MRIALAVLTLWLSLPPLVCQAACDARVANVDVPPCHAPLNQEQPAPEHERENCPGCESDAELFVTASDVTSLRGAGPAPAALARTFHVQPLEFASHYQRRAPPPGPTSAYARANPPLQV